MSRPNYGFTLNMTLWQRIKLLFGFGLRVDVVHDGESSNTIISVAGEDTTKDFRTVLSVSWPV